MTDQSPTCDVCGVAVRWVRTSRIGPGNWAGFWTHVRGKTEPGPRPWHKAVRAEAPTNKEDDDE